MGLPTIIELIYNIWLFKFSFSLIRLESANIVSQGNKKKVFWIIYNAFVSVGFPSFEIFNIGVCRILCRYDTDKGLNWFFFGFHYHYCEPKKPENDPKQT